MRPPLIFGVVLLCLAMLATYAEADSSDNAAVIGAFRRLSALHSFRETTKISDNASKHIFYREWLKTPPLLRLVDHYTYNVKTTIKTPAPLPLSWSKTGTATVIRTLNACYQQNDPSPSWIVRKPSLSEKKLLRKGIDYEKDLDLDKCEFTYQGIASLAGVPTRLYLFREMPENAKAIRGKVWIGSADDLPRRCDFDASKVGPYEILFDNFNGPVSTELPVVEETDSSKRHEP